MRNIYRNIILSAIAIATTISCAKAYSEGKNVAAKRALDAYVQTHYPGVGSVGFGTFILEDYPGNGPEVTDSSYVLIRYVSRDISDNTVMSYTDEDMAKQLGEYTETAEYGPYVFCLCQGEASQGVLDMFHGGQETIVMEDGSTVKGRTFGPMRVGSRRTCIIPGWLTSTSQYFPDGTYRDYMNNIDGGSNYYYDLTVVEITDDIEQWQIDSIERYMLRHDMVADTVHYKKGMYYWRNKVREQQRGVIVEDTVKFPSDTAIYINYIGRLLNGRVFDTNIEDTAKVWGLYSSSHTYAPTKINWSADSTAITMTESETSVITGFSYTLWNMHPFESGSGIFTSTYGYGSSGSGLSIAGYAPLMFEIDIVEEPEE